MSQQSKKHLLGRASVVAILAVALLVVGGILVFTRRALAQTAPIRGIVTFAPSLMIARGSSDGGPHNLLIGMLLPAVQRNGTPVRLEAFTGDGSVTVEVPDPDLGHQGTAFLDVFITDGTANGGLLLHVVNKRTGVDTTAAITQRDVTVRLLPAVQDGLLLPAVSVAETISGHRNITISDGTTQAIPFEYALPAVQLPAVQ